MSLLYSLYLSQISMKLLETLISQQGIKISIYAMQCMWGNIVFIWYNKFYNKRLVATDLDWFFFRIVDWLEPVFEGLVAVPEYLN